MLTIDFNIIQSCDCSSFSLVDATNVGVDYPVALFTTRTIVITYADGTQTTVPFPFTGGAFSPVLSITETKDFAASISLIYTPVTPVTNTVYNRTKNAISTCRADNIAQNKAKELLFKCDKNRLLQEMQDINAGITNAIRLTRLNDLEDAQAILDYLSKIYGGSCSCGCK